MNRNIVTGAAALVVFAAVIYFATHRTDEAPAKTKAVAKPPTADESSRAADVPLRTKSGLPLDWAEKNAAASQLLSDPRLAVFAVSPDNGRIFFVTTPDGKVIKEVDNDPASPNYRKPLREYTYAGDKVIGLAAYEYLTDRVQIRRTFVIYKPDGSVDRLEESTSSP